MYKLFLAIAFVFLLGCVGQSKASNCVGAGLDPDYLNQMHIFLCNTGNSAEDPSCAAHTDELNLDPQFSSKNRLVNVAIPNTLSRVFLQVVFAEPVGRNPQCVITSPSGNGTFSNSILTNANPTSILTTPRIGSNNIGQFVLTCNTPGLIPSCEQTIYQIRVLRYDQNCAAQGNPNNLLTNFNVFLGTFEQDSVNAPLYFNPFDPNTIEAPLVPNPFDPNARSISYPAGYQSDFKYKEIWVNATFAPNLVVQASEEQANDGSDIGDPIAQMTRISPPPFDPNPIVLNNLAPLAVGTNVYVIRVDAPPYCAFQLYTITLTRAAPSCPIPNNALISNLVVSIPDAPWGVQRVQVNPGFLGLPGTYTGLVGSDTTDVQLDLSFNPRGVNDQLYVNGVEWFIYQDNTTHSSASITLDTNKLAPATNNVVMVVTSDQCANQTYTVKLTKRTSPLWNPATLPAPKPIPNPQTAQVAFVDCTLSCNKKRNPTDQELIRALIGNALDIDVSNVAVNRYSPKVDIAIAFQANLLQTATQVAQSFVNLDSVHNPNFWAGTLLQCATCSLRSLTIQGPPVNIQQGPKDTGVSNDGSIPSAAYFEIVPVNALSVGSSADIPKIGPIKSEYFISKPPQIGVGFIHDIHRHLSSATTLGYSFILSILALLALFCM